VAASTFCRVSADTEAPAVKVRDTAEIDTPASSATSFAVTRRSATGALLLDLVAATMD
jgi:hypothetical protein